MESKGTLLHGGRFEGLLVCPKNGKTKGEPPTEGSTTYETETGSLWVGNGGRWVNQGSAAPIVAGEAVPRKGTLGVEGGILKASNGSAWEVAVTEGITITSSVDAGGHRFKGSGRGTEATDGATKIMVDDLLLFRRDGSNAPTTDFDMGSHEIRNVATPSDDSDCATKGYVDSFPVLLKDGSAPPTSDFDWGGSKLSNVGDPVNSGDALNLRGLEALRGTYLSSDGSNSPLGNVKMGLSGSSKRVYNLGSPVGSSDLITRGWAKNLIDTGAMVLGSTSPTAHISFGGNKITNLGAPSDPGDGVTKEFVEAEDVKAGNAIRGMVKETIWRACDLTVGDPWEPPGVATMGSVSTLKVFRTARTKRVGLETYQAPFSVSLNNVPPDTKRGTVTVSIPKGFPASFVAMFRRKTVGLNNVRCLLSLSTDSRGTDSGKAKLRCLSGTTLVSEDVADISLGDELGSGTEEGVARDTTLAFVMGEGSARITSGDEIVADISFTEAASTPTDGELGFVVGEVLGTNSDLWEALGWSSFETSSGE